MSGKSALVTLEDWIARSQEREAARLRNESPSYEEFTKLINSRKLDSTVKKCTGLVRKLKGYTHSMLEPIIKEIRVVNLTKYVSEVAGIIAEARFKMSDIRDIVNLCTMFHERYPDFSGLLLENFGKTLGAVDSSSTVGLTKLTVSICLCGELIVNGILRPAEGFNVLYKCIRHLVKADADGSQCISILTKFCNTAGEELAGLLPTSIQRSAGEQKLQLPRSRLVTVEHQELLLNELQKNFTILTHTLSQLHKRTIQSEKQNRRLVKYKGEIHAERAEEHAGFLAEFDKVLNSATRLCNELDDELPLFCPLPPDYDEDEKMEGLVKEDEEDETTNSGLILFGDEETRCFYQNFPDLMVYLPPIAYKESVRQAALEKEKIDQREKEMQEIDVELEAAELKDDIDTTSADFDDDADEEVIEPSPKPPPSASFDIFLKSLKLCVTKEMIDNAAYEFVNSHNTKSNCKLLADTLFDMPSRKNHLIPLWSRFVAILAPVFPTISLELCKRLHHDLRRLVRKKNSFHLEIKLRVSRHIGELVKFRVFPKSDAFSCLKLLLTNFVHHQIEMACALIETCGRFLYRSYESHKRMKIYLDVMMRKRAVKALESRYICLIDNAYVSVCPPEYVPHVAEKKSVMQVYIEYLLQGLCRETLEDTILNFRRLKWTDSNVKNCAIKCLCKPENATAAQIPYYASVIAGITKHQKDVSKIVVDHILESIDYGLDRSDAESNQRRLAVIKYLGEFYNYRLVHSDLIISVLYRLTTYGVSLNPSIPSALDPPNDYFRVRLCCWLLRTCSMYFKTKKALRKLDCFLTYFEYYYWRKMEMGKVEYDRLEKIPYSIVELVEETLELIRPDLAVAGSYQEASFAMENMQQKLREAFSMEIESYQESVSISQQRKQSDSGVSILSAKHEVDGDPFKGAKHPASSYAGAARPPGHKSNTPVKSDPARSPEDDDFTREFEKLCSEGSGPVSNIKREFHRVITEIPIPSRNVTEVDGSGESPPKFYLLNKPNQTKNTKAQLVPITIPVDSELVKNLSFRQKEAQDERAEVKRLTLKMNKLQLEEEANIEEAKRKAALGHLIQMPSYGSSRQRRQQRRTSFRRED